MCEVQQLMGERRRSEQRLWFKKKVKHLLETRELPTPSLPYVHVQESFVFASIELNSCLLKRKVCCPLVSTQLSGKVAFLLRSFRVQSSSELLASVDKITNSRKEVNQRMVCAYFLKSQGTVSIPRFIYWKLSPHLSHYFQSLGPDTHILKHVLP